MNKDIQINLSDEDHLIFVDRYLSETLSETSYELFVELAHKDNITMDEIITATGKAILNESICVAIKAGMEFEAQQKCLDEMVKINQETDQYDDLENEMEGKRGGK